MKRKLGIILLALVLVFALPGGAVLAADKDEIKPREVVMSTTKTTVRVNQTRTLQAEVLPVTAEDKSISWQSSNPEIAEVNDDGIVTGISPGTAEITATTVNGRKGTCVVTVPDYVLKGIKPDTDNKSNPAAEVDKGEALSAATVRRDVEEALKGKKRAAVTYCDKTIVSTAALRGAAYTAEMLGGEVSLRILTVEGGYEEPDIFQKDKPVPAYGQVIIYPALAGAEDKELNVNLIVDEGRRKTEAAKAAEALGRPAEAVILAQQGGFGMQVSVAAKVELAGIDRQALKLYRWDAESQAYALLPNQAHSLDENGFLYFSTSSGGIVIIAN